MKKKRLIKICGIQDERIAHQIAGFDIDYVGLIFYKKSKRFITLSMANKIMDRLYKASCQVVAVFVDSGLEEMLAVCHRLNIQCVQLHGDISRREAKNLPANIQRIYALNYHVKEINKFSSDIRMLNPERDFLLFDNETAGSGVLFNHTDFNPPFPLPFFIAGGLQSANVASVINYLNPLGVDVSSGVENQQGIKDPQKIKQFVAEVRKYDD